MKIIMPGPIFSVPSAISESLDLFQSCEDVQEAWVCNGDSQQASEIHVKALNGIRIHVNGTEIHVNGKQTGIKSNTIMDATSLEEGQRCGQESISEKDMACSEENRGDIEPEDEIGEAQGEEGDNYLAESINVPVVEARLSVDISQALTRQKIASVQRGRTLSFADKEDSQEGSTMAPRFFGHKDSLELGGLPQGPPSPGSPSCKTEKSIKICRNPSYHSAVRVSPVADSPPPTKVFTLGSQNYSSSSEGTPEHDCSFASAETIHKFPAKSGSAGAFAKTQPLDVPVAANMPRSASFSGGGILSPSSPAIDSFRQVYGRRGSISQPSTPVTKRAQLPKPLPKEVTHHHHHHQRNNNNNNNTIKITRGSALTRSFRRLFSTPLKTPSQTAPSSEDYWLDTPEPDSPTSSEPRSTSRLRKLSTNLSRKLSTRSKMSNSYTFPSGTNGHGQGIMPDSSKLVDYEELMKLFSCSGCQSIMAPPLHQCRKGHLVCNTCRLSLKQVCPVCRQRFAETTNLMMEQVCHLVKFPCKWSNTGCPEFYAPKARLDHEHFCMFRPLHCHHASKGCPKVLLMRDMEHHLQECEYRDFKEK